MTLRIFEKLLKIKKDKGASYMLFVGVKDVAVPFCFLAKKFGFMLDGLIVINSKPEPMIVPLHDFSGVPLFEANRLPFEPSQCLVALSTENRQMQFVWNHLVNLGFTFGTAINNEDITELFDALRFDNFISKTIRAEFGNAPDARVSIIDTGSKSRTLEQILRFSGMPIDGVITPSALKISQPPPVLIVPIENEQHFALSQALMQSNVGRVIPLFGGDLLAAERFWDANGLYFDCFDLENAPDFVAKFEDRLKQILNAYDEVNITSLNVENEDQIAMACALSAIELGRKVLHVVLPLNAANNQLNYAASAGNVMLSRSKMCLEVLTPQSREFWRYFIKRQPNFVSYSRSVYDYYVAQCPNEPLKLDNDLITFTDEEREQVCQSKSERFLSGEQLSKVVSARLMVSDKLSDRWLAMLYGVPIVLINMPTYTLDEKLIVRSEKSPMLMLPKRIIHEISQYPPLLRNVLKLEERISNLDEKTQFFDQNAVKFLDNTSEEIAAAVEEMLARIDGSFEYRDDEEYMDKTFRRLIANSKEERLRDVFDGHVSIDFLKNNQAMLGTLFIRRRGFLLKDFLPSAKSGRKIKVRAFFQRHWNALRTICEACVADAEIDLLIITHTQEQKDKFLRLGFQCLFKGDYDIASDKPDVFFINYFDGPIYIPGDIRKHSQLVVVASQTVVPYQSMVKDYAGDGFNQFIRYIERFWGFYNPDFYIFESYMYNHFKDIDFFKGKFVVEMGNPKYDGIYRACQNIRAVDGWEKLEGKTVILWAPDHGMWEEGVGDYVAFNVYAETMFQYMQSHPDMAMIVRPHPVLIIELCMHYWTDEDLYAFRKYCAESPNVVFDETDNYDNAFAMSEAIITDIDCGIRMSALPMMKPICLTYRSPDTLDHYADLTDYCYQVHSPDEMIAFLDMMERGDDPLHDIRERAAQRHVKHFDGKNGWRIKEFLKQALKIDTP